MTYFLNGAPQGSWLPPPSSTKGKIILLKDSTKADERDLLDHGLNLVIHSDPLEPAITTLRRENF